MDPGLGLHLLQEPTLDFLPLGVLPGPGEGSIHHLFMELHIHLVGRPLQPQDGDLLPLFEENALDETIPKNPNTSRNSVTGTTSRTIRRRCKVLKANMDIELAFSPSNFS